MIPEFWLKECGQSATGALLDYIAQNHIAAPFLANQAASESKLHVSPNVGCLFSDMMQITFEGVPCKGVYYSSQIIQVCPFMS